MCRRINIKRLNASERQKHFCAYCDHPMYVKENEDIVDFCKRHKVSQKVVKGYLSATADHIDPFDTDRADNICAAHSYCNNKKGQQTAEEFILFIKENRLKRNFKIDHLLYRKT